MAAEKSPFFPAGLAAAGLLGLTTQVSKRQEVSTSALSLPRKLLVRIPRMSIIVSTRSRSESHLNLATMVG